MSKTFLHGFFCISIAILTFFQRIVTLQTHMIKILINYEYTAPYPNLMHLITSQRGVVVRVTNFKLAGPGYNPIEACFCVTVPITKEPLKVLYKRL